MERWFREIDVAFATAYRLGETVEYAQIAEQEGFDSVWLAELYYNRGLIAIASAVAANTERVKIGLGIVSPFSRHPGVIAMEAATLDEMSEGRLLLGLGISQIAVDRQGITDSKSTVSLREAIEILRRFFSGETVVYDGQFFKITPPGTSLGFKLARRTVPIYIGAMGPKSLELAGRIADGAVLGMFSTPGFVRYVREHVERGLKASGRTWHDFDLRSYITFSIHEDSSLAKDATRRILVEYLSERVSTSASKVGSPRLKYSGVDEAEFGRVKSRVREYVAQGRLEHAEQSIPVELIDRLIVAGTPAECRAKLAEYRDAGLEVPVLYHVMGPDTKAGIRLAAKEILPLKGTGKRGCKQWHGTSNGDGPVAQNNPSLDG